VAATRAAHQDRAVRRRAAAELRRLEHQVRLSVVVVGTGGTTRLTAGDFLPLHPVTLYIGNRKIIVLHASARGSVSYVIDPAALGLPAGMHTLRLVSMLLTETRSFRSS